MLSIFVFNYNSTSLLRITFAASEKRCQGNFGKFQRLRESRFDGFEKDRQFLKIQNGSINLLGITSEESWFLISYIMLLKDVYMGWKVRRTLKLSMSFSLEYFFHLNSNLHTSCLSAFNVHQMFHLHCYCHILLWNGEHFWTCFEVLYNW